MMQNDPDPYIRAMHQDIPGGKWTALVICMLYIIALVVKFIYDKIKLKNKCLAYFYFFSLCTVCHLSLLYS